MICVILYLQGFQKFHLRYCLNLGMDPEMRRRIIPPSSEEFFAQQRAKRLVSTLICPLLCSSLFKFVPVSDHIIVILSV